MRPWARVVLRGFAIVNVLFGTVGLYFLVQAVSRHYAIDVFHDDSPYYGQAFYGMTVINLLLLLGLLAGSADLWRLQRRGLVICSIVFAGEVLYSLGVTLLGFLLILAGGRLAIIGGSLASSAGTGNMGINAQLLTGYPIIALIVLNIAYRRLHPAKA